MARGLLFAALHQMLLGLYFPAMPRCRLREAAPIVRQFCCERGVA